MHPMKLSRADSLKKRDRVGLRNVGTFLHHEAAVCPNRCHWMLSPRKLQDMLWDVKGKEKSLGR